MPRERIAELERFVHGDCQPDLTILFDVPIAVSRERLERARPTGRDLDKFEREEQAFFERVRDAYLERAAREPARFRVVDAARPLADVRARLDARARRAVTMADDRQVTQPSPLAGPAALADGRRARGARRARDAGRMRC